MTQYHSKKPLHQHHKIATYFQLRFFRILIIDKILFFHLFRVILKFLWMYQLNYELFGACLSALCHFFIWFWMWYQHFNIVYVNSYGAVTIKYSVVLKFRFTGSRFAISFTPLFCVLFFQLCLFNAETD